VLEALGDGVHSGSPSNSKVLTISASKKKLSYRRETARQLPTWKEGGNAVQPTPPNSAPSGYTSAYGRIRNPQPATRPAFSVPKAVRTSVARPVFLDRKGAEERRGG